MKMYHSNSLRGELCIYLLLWRASPGAYTPSKDAMSYKIAFANIKENFSAITKISCMGHSDNLPMHAKRPPFVGKKDWMCLVIFQCMKSAGLCLQTSAFAVSL